MTLKPLFFNTQNFTIMNPVEIFNVRIFVFDTLQDIRRDISNYKMEFAPVKYIDSVIEFKYNAIVAIISRTTRYKKEIYDEIDEMLNILSINNEIPFKEVHKIIHNKLEEMLIKYEKLNNDWYEQ